MEFNEKLQQLRKLKNLTQEQLAESLFVSRTAVSKWENGKGYPNIDSLKTISKLFLVSIDELLSSEEIIILAKNENNQNMIKVTGLVHGILDIITSASIFLPLFVQKEGDYFRSVSLMQFSESATLIIILSYLCLILISTFGIITLISQLKNTEKQWRVLKIVSITLNVLSIIFFIATRQLYVATYLFLFITFKFVLLLKIANTR